ncbi:MAG: DUF3859 domain-containing protein [Crocinitomicaceae bacterium]|nr:DUF3859 domain-containing protein [Crocinitomicaceae bacterium]
MSRILGILTVLLLTSCAVNWELTEKAKNVRAKELDAGTCSSLVVKTKKDRKSPSGKAHYCEYFRIKNSTDTIHAEVGTEIGVEFILIGDTRGNVPLTIVWTFPQEIETKRGRRIKKYSYKTSRSTHERMFATYKLSKRFQGVTGEWKLEIYHRRDLLMEKVFYLI